ncbi:MAG TPA: hypothetical protein EYP58_06050 [bacterium (Candidatus Stahlbacteria)]|nr:hypothetical protein [Candidatus Stahlbacteria bacterium]
MAAFLLAVIIFVSEANQASTPLIHLHLKHRKDSERIYEWVKRGSFYFNRWLGSCPYKELIIADSPEGNVNPGTVFIRGKDDYVLRSLETTVITELASQWIYPSPNQELALFTTYRYLEKVYGKKGLSKLPILELDQPFDCHYRYQMMLNSNRKNPQLVEVKKIYALRNLKEFLGKERFDRLVFEYLKNLRQGSEDIAFWQFVDSYTGKQLKDIYTNFIDKDGFCDLYVKEVEKVNDEYQVEIGNKGDLILPYKVILKTRSESAVYYASSETTLYCPSAKRPGVIIDPDFAVLEKSKTNNRTSAPPIITYKINRNLLERYPIYFVPYLWYSQDEGIATGGMAQGGLPLFGEELRIKHLLFVRSYYAWRKQRAVLEFTYETPIEMLWFKSEGRLDANEDMVQVRLKTRRNAFMGIHYSNLFDTTDLETRDFEKARQLSIDLGFGHPLGINVRSGLFDERFFRLTGELMGRIGKSPVSIRVFGGGIFGSSPVQEKIFLSGSLYPGIIGRIITQKKGALSAQEHLNYRGGPWLVGYYGQHLMGKFGYGMNLKIYFGPLFIFGDIGDVNDDFKSLSYRYDLGIGIKISLISIHLPFYVSDPKTGENRLAFRWLVSL